MFFFFTRYPSLITALRMVFLADLQLKRLLDLPDGEIGMFLNQRVDCFNVLLRQFRLAATLIDTQVYADRPFHLLPQPVHRPPADRKILCRLCGVTQSIVGTMIV